MYVCACMCVYCMCVCACVCVSVSGCVSRVSSCCWSPSRLESRTLTIAVWQSTQDLNRSWNHTSKASLLPSLPRMSNGLNHTPLFLSRAYLLTYLFCISQLWLIYKYTVEVCCVENLRCWENEFEIDIQFHAEVQEQNVEDDLIVVCCMQFDFTCVICGRSERRHEMLMIRSNITVTLAKCMTIFTYFHAVQQYICHLLFGRAEQVNAVLATRISVRPSVRLSHAWITLKRFSRWSVLYVTP